MAALDDDDDGEIKAILIKQYNMILIYGIQRYYSHLSCKVTIERHLRVPKRMPYSILLIPKPELYTLNSMTTSVV